MITLEEYKDELVSVYRYEIDCSEQKKEGRKEYLNQYYYDEYLNKIINDTYQVIHKIVDSSPISYYNIEMNDDTTSYISLNLTGGFFSDRLYTDIEGNIISEHILKKTFGSSLSVNLQVDEYERNSDDPDIISFDYRFSLYLQGFPKNMENIKKNLFGISKIKKYNVI